MLRPRESVRTLPSYHPPVADRTGLRLDFNENTVGCSARVLDCLRRLSADDLARYPEKGKAEQSMADFLGVAPAELLLTNGVDEAIHLLCQTYLGPGDQALIMVPTYSMYRIYMMASGAEVVSVPAGRDFEFPFSEMRTKITDRTRLIAVANPNNPTGCVVPPDVLLRLAECASSSALLVDEAYYEFYGQSLLSCRENHANLFIARTFSKAYGLAGLRLGALVGASEQMDAVRRVASPYNVNAIALACLLPAIDDLPHVQQYVEQVLQSRARLEDILEKNGIPFWHSQANFVLVKVGATPTDAKDFASRMRARGILVRDRSSDYGCEGCVRMTLGTREQSGQLIDAFQQSLEEMGSAQGAARS